MAHNPILYTMTHLDAVPGDDPFVTLTGGVGGSEFVGPTTTDPASIGTEAEVSEAGSKLVKFTNAGTEKASIDKDGLLTHGIAWDDVLGPSSTASGLAAVTVEKFADSPVVLPFFSHSQDDELYWTLQLPHRWNKGEVRFHLHIVPMADPVSSQVVRFDGTYVWAKYGQTIPAYGSWTAITAVSHTVAPGDVMKPTIVALFSSTPTGAKESDILIVRVRRPGAADALDTYETGKSATGGLTAAANICVLSADLHFQVVKAGTATEIPT